MASDALALSAPWRTTVSNALPLPWLLELNVDALRLLVTNHDDSGYHWPGPALHVDEFALVLMATEADRMTAPSFRALLRRLPKLARPLTWERVAWDGADPGGRMEAGRVMTLGAALRRLGASMVRLEVLEAGGGR